MSKYYVTLEITGIDMFTTIMQLVENNQTIRVVKAELDVATKQRRNIKRPRAASAPLTRGRIQDRFWDYLTKHPETCKNGVLTAEKARAWCVDNGYAETSASGMTSLMAREGMLQKTDKQGHYKVIPKK